MRCLKCKKIIANRQQKCVFCSQKNKLSVSFKNIDKMRYLRILKKYNEIEYQRRFSIFEKCLPKSSIMTHEALLVISINARISIDDALREIKYIDPQTKKAFEFENINPEVDELPLKDYYALVEYGFLAMAAGWRLYYAERLADRLAVPSKRPKELIINELVRKWEKIGLGILNQIEDEVLKIIYEFTERYMRNISLHIKLVSQNFLDQISTSLRCSVALGYALAKAEYELDHER